MREYLPDPLIPPFAPSYAPFVPCNSDCTFMGIFFPYNHLIPVLTHNRYHCVFPVINSTLPTPDPSLSAAHQNACACANMQLSVLTPLQQRRIRTLLQWKRIDEDAIQHMVIKIRLILSALQREQGGSTINSNSNYTNHITNSSLSRSFTLAPVTDGGPDQMPPQPGQINSFLCFYSLHPFLFSFSYSLSLCAQHSLQLTHPCSSVWTLNVPHS